MKSKTGLSAVPTGAVGGALFSLAAAVLIAAGCGGTDVASDSAGTAAPAPADLGTDQSASVTRAQTPLNGNDVPKFVDPVPTFSGRRVDGTRTVRVDITEFQQNVLPASVYANLKFPFKGGTFLWGYDIN